MAVCESAIRCMSVTLTVDLERFAEDCGWQRDVPYAPMGFDCFSLSHDFCGFLAGEQDGRMGRRDIHVSPGLRERRHNDVIVKAALA
jgi:hypothetical protein